jgi:hypothetical protein
VWMAARQFRTIDGEMPTSVATCIKGRLSRTTMHRPLRRERKDQGRRPYPTRRLLRSAAKRCGRYGQASRSPTPTAEQKQKEADI